MKKVVTLKKREAFVFEPDLIGKADIEARVRGMLHRQIKEHTATHLYLVLKQVEHAVATALEEVKPLVMNEAKSVMGEKKVAVFGGHRISLRDKTSWQYPHEIEELAARQKKELDAERKIAQEEERAIKTVTGTVISVELAP
jgi:hypothetical protein